MYKKVKDWRKTYNFTKKGLNHKCFSASLLRFSYRTLSVATSWYIFKHCNTKQQVVGMVLHFLYVTLTYTMS